MQSLFFPHGWPSRHPGQLPPPQSIPVSWPFFFMSRQPETLAQRIEVQLVLAQSWLTLQIAPLGQPVQLPPQSRSVSSLSRVTLKQCPLTHRPPAHC